MKWTPPEEWARLKQGIDCPMCADKDAGENPFSFKVTDLPSSVVRLPRNQYMRGWTIVILKRHAAELYELQDHELLGFWHDVAIVAAALQHIYQPAKINYCIFGHHVPHVHCHLLVHSFEDDPSKPINMHEQEVLLDAADYARMREDMREAIQIRHRHGL